MTELFKFLSVYGRRSADGPLLHKEFPIGHGTRLTPKLAQSIIAGFGFRNGVVYDDYHMEPTGVGTLMYRVYVSGRTKREFWPLSVNMADVREHEPMPF